MTCLNRIGANDDAPGGCAPHAVRSLPQTLCCFCNCALCKFWMRFARSSTMFGKLTHNNLSHYGVSSASAKCALGAGTKASLANQ